MKKHIIYDKSEEEKRADCESIVETSKRVREQCERYRLPYYDTSYHREGIYQSIFGF